MPTPVTDPALLAQLNGAPSGPQPVTDPALLAQLNGGQVAPAGRDDPNDTGEVKLDVGQLKGLARGVGMGLVDPIIGLGQLGAHGVKWARDKLGWESPTSDAALASRDKEIADLERTFQEKQRASGIPEGGDLGRVAGQAASPINALAAAPVARAAELIPWAVPRVLARGTGVGAGMGVTEPVHDASDYWGAKGDQILTGAKTGAVTEPVAATLGRLVRGVQDPAKQLLLHEGVPLTTGQMLADVQPGKTPGGIFKTTEDKMASWPIVGDFVKARQAEANFGYNEAGLNRALGPIGERLPHNMEIGREALDYTSHRLSDHYEQLLPGMTATLDPAFHRDMAHIMAEAQRVLPAEQAQNLRQIHNEIFDTFLRHSPPNRAVPVIPGDAMKGIDTTLGEHARGYAADTLYNNRRVAPFVDQIQDSFRALIARSNPHDEAALRAANAAWRQWVPVRDAAYAADAKQGVFSPYQLGRAARNNARTTGQAVRGESTMQDLGDAGQMVLPQSVSNSGTADRKGLMELAMALFGGHAAGVPVNTLAGGAAALGLYTQPGQAMARAIMAGSPQTRAAIADAMHNLHPTRAAASLQNQD